MSQTQQSHLLFCPVYFSIGFNVDIITSITNINTPWRNACILSWDKLSNIP